jgi:hypothetical protein
MRCTEAAFAPELIRGTRVAERVRIRWRAAARLAGPRESVLCEGGAQKTQAPIAIAAWVFVPTSAAIAIAPWVIAKTQAAIPITAWGFRADSRGDRGCSVGRRTFAWTRPSGSPRSRSQSKVEVAVAVVEETNVATACHVPFQATCRPASSPATIRP